MFNYDLNNNGKTTVKFHKVMVIQISKKLNSKKRFVEEKSFSF